MDGIPAVGGRPARRLALAWLPAAAWAAFVFVLSAQPDLRVAPDEGLDLVLRKIGHMAVFGILALLVRRALAASTRTPRPSAWAFVLVVAYAASDELHQAFVAGRHGSIVDVAIDAAGALLALVGLALVRAVRVPRRQGV